MSDPGDLLFGDFQRQMQRDINEAFGLPAELLQTNSNSTGSSNTMTCHEMLARMREAEEILRRQAKVPRLHLVEDASAVLPGPPVRTYAKCRAKSESHWRRMNKKWLKRYGITWLPTAYQMDLGHQIWIIVHPTLTREYQAAINAHFPLRS